ncbi:T9SS type A sorting domain-containing protein [candidate division WOR-3 bacterium]|nr:T9SS type A sorting domain-containing protein [candidate division WOR-3 bacterium]
MAKVFADDVALLNRITGPYHDIATGMRNPGLKVDAGVPVAPRIILANRGTYDETAIPVSVAIDSAGARIYQQQMILPALDSAETDSIDFPAWTPGPGGNVYQVAAWHSLAGDTNRMNDTARRVVTVRRHDLAMQSMNVGARVRALNPFAPTGFINNLGDYAEAGFSAFCKVESAGVEIYSQSVTVDSVPIGATRPVAFPTWYVGPESTNYTLTMWHNCGPDQNRRNDTLARTTMSSASVLRVAIEIAATSAGRTPPNACYRIDSLCDALGWTDSIVVGTDIDEVSELANYDVVVTGDVGYNDNDFLTYQSALLQWVRQGGGFVGLGWIVYGIANQNARMMDSALAVNCINHYGFTTLGQVHIIDNTHPITMGVSDFNVYSHGEYAVAGMWPGATMLGDYTAASGQASIACKREGAGRSVYLGPIYFGTFGGYQNEPYYDDENAMRLLKQSLEWAAWGTTGVEQQKEAALLPRLTEARPNPLREHAVIGYSLPRELDVRLSVYDLGGRLVTELGGGAQQAGRYSVAWNRTDRTGARVSPGVYFCKLSSGSYTATRKLVVE